MARVSAVYYCSLLLQLPQLISQLYNYVVSSYYRPQRSCGQGNVFTGVCLSTGGEGCLPQCMLGYQTPLGPGRPPGTRQTPPQTRQNPPGLGRPPQTRQTSQTRQPPLGPGRHPPTRVTPPNQADTPPGPGRHPPDQADPPPDQADPPGKQTAAYGLRAAGTHPTGMHSCSVDVHNTYYTTTR